MRVTEAMIDEDSVAWLDQPVADAVSVAAGVYAVDAHAMLDRDFAG